MHFLNCLQIWQSKKKKKDKEINRTQYIGHNIYYRVVNAANANKIKWDYVHFHNLDILEQEIVQKIEKMKEGSK